MQILKFHIHNTNKENASSNNNFVMARCRLKDKQILARKQLYLNNSRATNLATREYRSCLKSKIKSTLVILPSYCFLSLFINCSYLILVILNIITKCNFQSCHEYLSIWYENNSYILIAKSWNFIFENTLQKLHSYLNNN